MQDEQFQLRLRKVVVKVGNILLLSVFEVARIWERRVLFGVVETAKKRFIEGSTEFVVFGQNFEKTVWGVPSKHGIIEGAARNIRVFIDKKIIFSRADIDAGGSI